MKRFFIPIFTLGDESKSPKSHDTSFLENNYLFLESYLYKYRPRRYNLIKSG